MPNRLIEEKSPYLLQHANNPVDWYPWCDEAFTRAQRENKPVFLSIGYSSCHWCHVMEEESFENQQVAKLLNGSFISIKVDKEERPDIDGVYMAVCQAFTGQGGWPTTVLLTPDQRPFFAGTYFPRERTGRNPGLLDILAAAKEAWDSDPSRLQETGDKVTILLSKSEGEKKAEREEWRQMGMALVEKALAHYTNTFDPVWGGFGRAPKFPAPHNLLFLMKLHDRQQPEDQERQDLKAAAGISSNSGIDQWVKKKGKKMVATRELEMVEKTLIHMYAGGLYDHIGFGFCRYATDEKWLVPHFEKMLYDNALLAMAYAECWRITGKPFYRRVTEEILEYVSREMKGPEGGFYSAQDADSEGEEGRFYVFTPEEIRSVLGEEQGDWFCDVYSITEGGNFEGKSIPNLIETMKNTEERVLGLEEETEWSGEETPEQKKMRRSLAYMKKKLREYRKERTILHTDDKVLTSWNSLMIVAFARAYQILGKKEYLLIARRAEAFIREKLVKTDGGLRVRYRDGDSAGDGFLDDYAFYEWALLELSCASHRACYLQKAIETQDKMMKEFWDEEKGGFYFIGKNQEQLIFRPKETYDGAIPSGNSAACLAMIKLFEKMGESEERSRIVDEQLSFLTGASARSHPAGTSLGMTALLEWEQKRC